jgi:hypothetical protein
MLPRILGVHLDSLLLLFVEKYYTAAAHAPELVYFLNNIKFS